MALDRNSFLNYKALPRAEVHVPELGGSVFVRALTAREKDQFEAANAKAKGRDFRARLVVACACDEGGVDLFRADDLEAVAGLSCAALDPVVTAALKANRFTDEDVAELEKN